MSSKYAYPEGAFPNMRRTRSVKKPTLDIISEEGQQREDGDQTEKQNKRLW